MSEKNIAVVQQIYQAFTRGDVPGIMELVSDELRGFGVVAEATDVPWHMQITKKLSIDNTMHRFTLKNGRVVEWRGTEDTLRIHRALFG
ncbi:MAG TPA: hypothetical protein VKE22_01625 [Haliangiales bacterium]|nr:hypothetical protein [Haliangiales bacterium]